MLLAEGTQLDEFTILRHLASGGMGEVYLATDTRLGREVAIKVIADSLSSEPDFLARFQEESRAAASLDHPNVVTVYSSGEASGSRYIVMRYVDGLDLGARMREGRLNPDELLDILGQIAGALDAAHASGLIHGDVKPGNILVASGDGGVERAYLADFGLARSLNAAPSSDRPSMGTIHYIAPEQIRGGDLDLHVDVYQLGCVLFEGLTGRVPFPSGTSDEELRAHLESEPPSASLVDPSLPDAVDAVFARALDKDPSERFDSCSSLIEAASSALAQRPTDGSPSESPTVAVTPPPMVVQAAEAEGPPTAEVAIPAAAVETPAAVASTQTPAVTLHPSPQVDDPHPQKAESVPGQTGPRQLRLKPGVVVALIAIIGVVAVVALTRDKGGSGGGGDPGGGGGDSTGVQPSILAVPMNLRASVGTDEVRLRWDPSPGADQYQIIRDGQDLATTQVGNFVDHDVAPATSYAYSVVAVATNRAASPPAVIVATTTRPSNAAGRLQGRFNVEMTITSVSVPWPDSPGDRFTYEWHFQASCGRGPCDADLWFTDFPDIGGRFYRSGGDYHNLSSGAFGYTCHGAEMTSRVTFDIHVTESGVRGSAWRVITFRGTAEEVVLAS